MSERPWPENAAPTPEQFADWYVTAPRDERVVVAGQLLAASERSARCFLMNHDGAIDELAWARQRLNRYHLAWLSARRRIHPARFLRAYGAATNTEATQ